MSSNSFQDLLDAVGQIAGGTPPDPIGKPGYYSGYAVGDGTGVPNLKAAFSRAPEVVQELPACVILPGSFTAKLGRVEENHDRLRLIILISRNDAPSEWPQLTQWRDSFPATFRDNMSLLNTAGVQQVFFTDGKAGTVEWGGQLYLSWEMTLDVLREFIATYVN